MTFTFTPSTTPNNVTQVRYHLGDTEEAIAMFSDEEISMAVAMTGSVGGAVVALIKAAMAKIAHEPDTRADWQSVQWRTSVDAWQKLLIEKRREFGLGARVTVKGKHAYRGDSYQRREPDWAAIFRDYLLDDDWCLP